MLYRLHQFLFLDFGKWIYNYLCNRTTDDVGSTLAKGEVYNIIW
jgi:hypothetical protein